ncbi:MAG: 6-carboxytetrahydropterin synthase [Bacteroidetes bacterium]|nr:6-carboxytetrahydropterin synthase [Bacteroidota bacterium]
MTALVSVTRTAQFNAAHRLYVPEWSDEQNRLIFGLCANPSFHGHNYDLHVTVTGPIDPVTGYVMDLKILKEILELEVMDRYDHRNLNLDTEDFKTLNPTVENICVVIWNRVKNRLPDNYKLSVKLYETPRNYAEYHGQ